MRFVCALTFLALGGVNAGPQDIPTVQVCQSAAGLAPCYSMPVVGQGSCCGTYNISSWLSAGGTHIDTSCDYGSQPTVGAAVRASGVPRSSLWITSKLNVESCAPNMTADLFSLVLGPLGMDYVDLLLLHHAGRWETDNNPRPPCFDVTQAGPSGNGTYYKCRMQTVPAMQAIVAAGYARTWGVSNWQVRGAASEPRGC
jgi:diketogulonate reductase-like aldo/keto reductase